MENKFKKREKLAPFKELLLLSYKKCLNSWRI